MFKMSAYSSRPLLLVKILFLIAFLTPHSLMAMDGADDVKDGHTTIKVKAPKRGTPGKSKGPNFKERSQRITDLEGKCETFNKSETSALYRKSKAITDFLTRENRMTVSKEFKYTMSYVEILLSPKRATTFRTSWDTITVGMDIALKGSDPILILIQLNKNMRTALGIKAPTGTKTKPFSGNAPSKKPINTPRPKGRTVTVTIAAPAALPPQECCGGYSACCKAGGCGFRAWTRVKACVTWCKNIRITLPRR